MATLTVSAPAGPHTRSASRARKGWGRLVSSLWSFVVLAIPLYVFPSGRPQPADVGLALFLGVMLLATFGALNSTERTMSRRLFEYVAWVAVVNVMWIQLAGYEATFLFSTAFAVFNATVFVGFISFASVDTRHVVSITGKACALALVGLGLLSVLRPGLSNGPRLLLTFNNPNQLAYYCLGALTVVYLAKRADALPRSLWVGATLASGFIIFQTYSRAALGGYVLLCAIPFIRRPIYILLACIPLVVVAGFAESAIDDDPLWQTRVQESGSRELDDYLQDRGIDRVIRNPQYLLLGAGEGRYERFHPFGLELHSSIASILFCYGLVGLALISRVAAVIARRLPLSVVSYLAPSLVYSLFHNGMRFRIFWLSLAVAAVLPRLLEAEVMNDSSTESSRKSAST